MINLFSRAFSSSMLRQSTSTQSPEIVSLTEKKTKEQKKIDRIWIKNPWDIDGERTMSINKKIMEFIAVDLQPFSVVEDIGFRRA